MKPVIKGEKITAQKFNEVIDAINNAGGAYGQHKVDPLMPDGFVVVGNITSELGGDGNQTFTLSSVQLLNTWRPNGEPIGDRTITENLNQLTSFYLVKEMPSERHPEPTSDVSVLTNVEAGSLDPQLEWDKRLLYEVSCNVSTGTFEIIRDYRIANGICSSGGNGGGRAEPQGAFRWGDIEQKEEKKYGKIKYCNFQFGRKYYIATSKDWTVPVKACTFYLYVIHSNPGGSMIVTNDYGNTLTSTTIPLFSIDDEGNVTDDFRGMPVVPVWSTAQG